MTVLGGPTALLEIAGLRLLTDPTFDAPGRYPTGSRLEKTTPPAWTAEQVGELDAVLLSHDQHPDNLDISGRELLRTAPVVLTTPLAAGRLDSNAIALSAWEEVELVGSGGQVLTVTGVPARHGPEGCEPVTGPVTGFVLSGEDLPTLYVSGDNASLDHVQAIAERCGPVDVALLFAGAARTALFDGANLTLTSDEAAEAARILGARRAVLVHVEGWAHFTEGPATLPAAFERAGILDRLTMPTPGTPTRP
ncbi:MBL fold metallo-hydrolase [Pengzhenrongella sp.]|uniref:MBL fold metallo-hydrolase n=1 Tax=Pengzhenrongella sp. TaxID=2888820 RepID=UPI002F940DF6